MPVLRDRSLTAHHRGDSNIAVSCPRCGSEINVSMFSGDKPIRCDACFYPLLTRGDLLPFVSACEQVSNSDAQCVNLAAHILSKLSETVPEAAMAMNRLVNRMPFTTVSEFERFSALVNAYAYQSPWFFISFRRTIGFGIQCNTFGSSFSQERGYCAEHKDHDDCAVEDVYIKYTLLYADGYDSKCTCR